MGIVINMKVFELVNWHFFIMIGNAEYYRKLSEITGERRDLEKLIFILD